MNCPNCGVFNDEGMAFCGNCGNKLKEDNPIGEENNMSEQIDSQKNEYNQSFHSVSSFNYLTYAIGTLIKPFDTFKKNEENLKELKNSFILTAIIAGVMMIVNLIKSMISAVFVKNFDFSTFKYETELDLSRLKELDYLELIGKNLLIYIAIILGIAVVYYLASLVAKKSPSFIKLVSASATSFIPYIVLAMIISPILGKVWDDLAVISMIIGTIYSIIIFVYLVNEEIEFSNKDNGIYFHLACISILLIIAYYMGTEFISKGIANNVASSLVNMFN